MGSTPIRPHMNNNKTLRNLRISTKIGVALLYAGFALFVVIAVLLFAGCGANDASVSGRDTGPGFKINMPNHFGTVARKCDGPNMIYETENGNSPGKGAFSVVANDPRCKGSTP